MEPYNQNEGENKILKENLENQVVKKEEAPLVNSKIPKIVISLIIFLAVVVLIFVINKVIQKNDKNKLEDDYLTWKNNSTTTIEAGLTTTTLETATTTPTTVKKTTITKKTTTPTKSASTSLSATNDYLKARSTYQTSGYYFQFLNCKGAPGILTAKKGTKLMLDNRDDKMRKIVFIGKLYNINAYGYAIVTADKLGKHYITCDGGGAAQITVQP